jgi:hypothetical protein
MLARPAADGAPPRPADRGGPRRPGVGADHAGRPVGAWPQGVAAVAWAPGAAVRGGAGKSLGIGAAVPADPYARLARGCRPRGCRAPARRVHGRRVRYVIGDVPGQVNGMRWHRTRRCG